MHNENDEFEKKENSHRSSAFGFAADSSRDGAREASRRASYREQEAYPQRASGNSPRDKEPRGTYSPRFSSNEPDNSRILLKAVNDVLNQYFPLKTLFADVEFDCFRDKVVESVSEMVNDPSGFLAEIKPDADLSSQASIDAEIDNVLRELFFHAGGTLVNALRPREERIQHVAEYLAAHRGSISFRLNRRPKTRDDFVLETLWSGVPADSPSSVEADFANCSESFDGLSEPSRPVAAEGEDSSSSFAKREEDDETSRSAPYVEGNESWFPSYRKAAEISARYFHGERVPLEKFEVFRRLFFLASNVANGGRSDFASDSSSESLEESAKDAVEEILEPNADFYVPDLKSIYAKISEGVLLEKKSPTEIDELTQIVLKEIGKKLGLASCDDISDSSDFRDAYLAIAKFVLTRQFQNRRFSDDDSDFDDYYKEFLRVAGSRAVVSKSDVRGYFVAVGGKFHKTTDAESEPDADSLLSRGELIKKILFEEFKGGLDLFEHEALERFRRVYENRSRAELDSSDSKLRAIICRCSTICDGRAYSTTEKNRRFLKRSVEGLVKTGVGATYYEAFFDKKASWLISANISNWRVLRALLASCFPKYFFYEHYFESVQKVEFEFLKVRHEILRVWGADDSVRKPEELAQRTYVTVDRIKRALEVDKNDFVSEEDGFARVTTKNKPDVLLGDKKLDEMFHDGEDSRPDERYPADGIPGKLLQTLLCDEVKDNGVSLCAKTVSSKIQLQDDESDDFSNAVAENHASLRESEGAVPALDRTKLDKAENVDNLSVAPSLARDVDVSVAEWRKHANMIAKILSKCFKEGLNISDHSAYELFREKAKEKGLVLDEPDDRLLALLKRVGFVCEGRVHVVSQKTKAQVVGLVDSWFAQGGSVIYFETFFSRHRDLLIKGGVSTVQVLENRLRKYYPECSFFEEYFEQHNDGDERTLAKKIADDITVQWDGKSARRLNDLADSVYIPRDVIEQTLKEDDNFEVRSNGYWIRRDTAGKKRVTFKRKISKK